MIKECVADVFGTDATVRLFGSRVDDTARGGDIDLLVEAKKVVQERERKALQLVAKLQLKLGDQPIDVLVLDPEVVIQSVHEEAIRTGVKL